MIANSTQLTVAIGRLRTFSAALECLRVDLKDKDPALFTAASQSYIERIQTLQDDMFAYLALSESEEPASVLEAPASYAASPAGHFVADNSTYIMIDALSEISHGPSLDVSSGYVDAFGIAALENAGAAGAVRLLVGCDLNEMPTAQDIITFENAHAWKDTGNEPIERTLDDSSIAPAVRTLKMPSVRVEKAAAKNHSKLYVDQSTGIVGSSNLTRAGMLGQRELNLLQRRPDAVARLRQWFDAQWDKASEAKKEPFNERLIEWLENARVQRYAPFHPYAKALFERFRHRFLALAPSAGDIDLAIFQQEGRDAALSILAEHRCCIIADAVGMGKTFVALGAAQRRAQVRPRSQREALVICPAQMERVWQDAAREQGVHLRTESMETLGQTTSSESEERLRKLGQYAIVVVDEAHNFRNPLANRFGNLMRVLSDGPQDKEVLLLTATPINNGIGDLYSLYRLMTRDDDSFFQTTNLRMRSLKEFFKDVEKNSASTTDLLLETMVCRSRLDIRHRQDAGEVIVIAGKEVRFPTRNMTALNYSLCTGETDLTYQAIGTAIEALTLGADNVEQYARQKDAQADQTYQRLQTLFKILLLKRLESSIAAFVTTGGRLLSFSDAVVTALRQGRKLTNDDYRKLQQDFTTELFDEDEGDQSSAYLAALAEKDPSNYDVARLAEDVAADHALLEPLLVHARAIQGKSDGKIARLKQELASMLPGKKILLFTFYSDTASYIHGQLTSDREFMDSIRNARLEVITGGLRPSEKTRMVREFAPISNGRKDDMPVRPIQLLISTDVLAEGQNLQDCGYLINYDLHFNPVRMIQRNGRIDRLFSEHEEITIANFFPEEALDAQLQIVNNLQTKIARIQANMPMDSSVIGEAVRVFSLEELRRTRAGDVSVIDDIEARNPINVFQNTLNVALKLLLDFGIEQIEKIPFGCQSNKRSTRTGLFLCVRAKSEAYPNTSWWLLYPDALSPALEPAMDVSEILPLIESQKSPSGLPDSPDVLPRDIHWPAILDAENRCRAMLVEQRRNARIGQTWPAGHINRKIQHYFAARPDPPEEELAVRLGRFDLSRHKSDAESSLNHAKEDKNADSLIGWLNRTLPVLQMPKENPETVPLELVCYLELVPENQQALSL